MTISEPRSHSPFLRKDNGYLVAPRALDYPISGSCEQREDPPEHSHWHSAVAKLCGKLTENIQVEFTGNNSKIINNSNTWADLRMLYKTGMQREKQRQTLQSIRNIFQIICSSDWIITTTCKKELEKIILISQLGTVSCNASLHMQSNNLHI